MLRLVFLYVWFILSAPAVLCGISSRTSTSACPTTSSPTNSIFGYPRIDFHATLRSADVGDYSWYTCDSQGNNCQSVVDNMSFNDVRNGNPDSTHPAFYIQTLVVFIIFFVLFALLSLCSGFLLFVGRYLCCCVRGGTCGKRWPTHKTKLLGYEVDVHYHRRRGMNGELDETGTSADPNGLNAEESAFYPPNQRWCARGLVWTFVAITFAFILVGYFLGTTKVNSAAKSFVTAPDSLASTLQSLSAPISSFMVNVASDTLSNLLLDVNQTVYSVAPMDKISADLRCLLNPFDNNGLPDLNVLGGFLSSVMSTIIIISNIINQVPSTLNALLASFAVFQSALAISDGYLGASNQDVSAEIAILAGLPSSLSSFDSTQNSLLAPLPPLLSDFASLSLPNYTYVTNSLVGSSTSDPSGAPSLFSLTSNVCANAPCVTSLTDKVNGLLYDMSSKQASPNTTVMSNRMSSVSSLVGTLNITSLSISVAMANATSVLVQMRANMVAANNSLLALSSSSSAMSASALTPAYTLLAAMNSTLALFPNFIILSTETAKIRPLNALLPCINDLLSYIAIINATLFSVPPDLNQVFSLSNDLNNTLATAISQVDVITANVAIFQSNLTSFENNVVTYFAQIQSLNSTLGNFSGQVQVASITAQIGAFVQQVDVFNVSLAAIYASFQALLSPSTLGSTFLSASALNTLSGHLSAVSIAQSQLISSQLSNLVANLQTYESSGFTYDALDQSLISNVSSNLQLLAAFNNTFYSSYVNTLTSLNASLPISPSISAFSAAPLATFQQELLGFQTVLPTAMSSLESFNGTVNSLITSSITPLYSLSSSLSLSISSLDLSSVTSALSSLNSSFISVQKDISQLHDAQTLLNTLKSLVFQQMSLYLNRLSAPALETKFQQGGLTSMVLELASIVDEISMYINNSYVTPLTLLNDVNKTDLTRPLDALSTNKYSSYGSIYMLGQLVLSSRMVDLSQIPTAYKYNEDVNGNSYPFSEVCVTETCLDNSVDYYTSSSLSTLVGGPVSFSPPDFLSLLYVIPGFIAILAFIASIQLKSYAWASWLSSITAALIFIFLPIFFVLIGLLYSLLMIPLADVCYGGPNVGSQYIAVQHDQVCSQFSGIGTAASCAFKLYNQTQVVVDIPGVYDAVVGSCDPSNDPLMSMWNSLAATSLTLPTDKLNDIISTLNSNAASSGSLQIRPVIVNLLLGAAQSTSGYLQQLIDSLGATLGCAPLHSSFNGLKSALCCTTGDAMYWTLGSWMIITWAMFCCGCPGAILGRKRFANNPKLESNQMMPAQYTPDALRPHVQTQAMVIGPDGQYVPAARGTWKKNQVIPLHLDGETGELMQGPAIDADEVDSDVIPVVAEHEELMAVAVAQAGGVPRNRPRDAWSDDAPAQPKEENMFDVEDAVGENEHVQMVPMEDTAYGYGAEGAEEPLDREVKEEAPLLDDNSNAMGALSDAVPAVSLDVEPEPADPDAEAPRSQPVQDSPVVNAMTPPSGRRGEEPVVSGPLAPVEDPMAVPEPVDEPPPDDEALAEPAPPVLPPEPERPLEYSREPSSEPPADAAPGDDNVFTPSSDPDPLSPDVLPEAALPVVTSPQADPLISSTFPESTSVGSSALPLALTRPPPPTSAALRRPPSGRKESLSDSARVSMTPAPAPHELAPPSHRQSVPSQHSILVHDLTMEEPDPQLSGMASDDELKSPSRKAYNPYLPAPEDD